MSLNKMRVELLSHKNQPNGYAGLNEFGNVTANLFSLVQLPIGPASTVLTMNAGGTAAIWAALTGAPHELLDGATDSDTTATTVVQGMIIIGNATPAWTGLAIGSANKVLHSNGTTASWQSLAEADLPTTTLFTDVARTMTSALTFTTGLFKAADIADANGNKSIVITATASAVDYITVTNGATANPATVSIVASGSDANINLSLRALGTGKFQILSAADATKILQVDLSGATTAKTSVFAWPFTNNRTLTFPDNTDTIAAIATNQTWGGLQTYPSGVMQFKDSNNHLLTIITDTGANGDKSYTLPGSSIAQTFVMKDLTQTLTAKTITTLKVNGLVLASTSKTTTYTATASDNVIFCDATGGAFTITLPAANANKQWIIVIKTDSSINAVTVSRAGADTFQGGGTTISLATQFNKASIFSDGTSVWYDLGAGLI